MSFAAKVQDDFSCKLALQYGQKNQEVLAPRFSLLEDNDFSDPMEDLEEQAGGIP